MSDFENNLVEICLDEWEYFDKGKKKEHDDPQYKRVGRYWKSIGKNINGRTLYLNKTTGKKYNPPWSSAFISYVVRNAGAENGFKYGEAHCHYVHDFIKGRNNAIYEAVPYEEYAPKPGDILHYGRRKAKTYDFDEAVNVYDSDSFYPSHSDVVISIKMEQGYIYTIGGNIRNDVGRKTIAVNSNGTLKPRYGNKKTYPWICILRCIK